MPEAKIHIETESLKTEPSTEIIADTNTAWHAIRGYDFAGLEEMLVDGLSPSSNQQDHAVCLSVSPYLAWPSDREANSFFAYTMRGGISLAINQDYPQHPTGDYGGFVDEIRLPGVQPDAIEGVMLPDESVDTPLTAVATVHEARKPHQAQRYIERTLRQITDLGGGLPEQALDLLSLALEESEKGNLLNRDISGKIEKTFMAAYADALMQKHGIENPTVGDMLRLVFERAEMKPRVYTYTEEQKKDIMKKNAKIAHRRYGELALDGFEYEEY